jgi:hypothetical protein
LGGSLVTPEKRTDIPKVEVPWYDELRVRALLQEMEMENNLARMEAEYRDGWNYDHAQRIRELHAEIHAILASKSQENKEGI